MELVPVGLGASHLKPQKIDLGADQLISLGRNESTCLDTNGLNFEYVSRNHAEIICSQGEVFVKPMSRQRDWVRVNSMPCPHQELTKVMEGDVISLLGRLNYFNFQLIRANSDLSKISMPALMTPTVKVEERLKTLEANTSGSGSSSSSSSSSIINVHEDIFRPDDLNPIKRVRTGREDVTQETEAALHPVLNSTSQSSATSSSRVSLPNAEESFSQGEVQIIEIAKSSPPQPPPTSSSAPATSSRSLEQLVTQLLNSPTQDLKNPKEDIVPAPTPAPAPAPVTSTQSVGPNIEDQFECPICLCSIALAHSIVPCGDTFCYSCIKDWSQKSSNCPMCNSSFDAKLISHNRILDNMIRQVLTDKYGNSSDAVSQWETRYRENQSQKREDLQDGGASQQRTTSSGSENTQRSQNQATAASAPAAAPTAAPVRRRPGRPQLRNWVAPQQGEPERNAHGLMPAGSSSSSSSSSSAVPAVPAVPPAATFVNPFTPPKPPASTVTPTPEAAGTQSHSHQLRTQIRRNSRYYPTSPTRTTTMTAVPDPVPAPVAALIPASSVGAAAGPAATNRLRISANIVDLT